MDGSYVKFQGNGEGMEYKVGNTYKMSVYKWDYSGGLNGIFKDGEVVDATCVEPESFTA